MKKARRLLNMVTQTLGGGSLVRVDANRHLFFPSTAQALHHRRIQQQQQATTPPPPPPPQNNDYDGVLRLPNTPKLRFKPCPSHETGILQFFPLGSSSGEGSSNKIVCVDEAGRCLLYDAGASIVHTMPTLGDHTTLWSPASFAVTRAADDAHDPDRPDALYLLDSTAGGGFQFQALVYGDPDRDPWPCPESHRSSVWLDVARESFAWHWRKLPPPPVHDADRDSVQSYYYDAGRDSSFSIQSYALLHGTIICVSFNRPYATDSRAGIGTYCFDTGAGEWTKAGDWTLPFYHTRALHVPELGDDLLFGINGLRFCAVDVSCAMTNTTNNDGSSSSSAPVLRHAWPDVDEPLPEDWHPSQDSVAYLGAGRFCVHRGFNIMATDGYGDSYTVDTATLLTGVEVVRDAGGSSKLQMVRHKTKRVDFNVHHLL